MLVSIPMIHSLAFFRASHQAAVSAASLNFKFNLVTVVPGASIEVRHNSRPALEGVLSTLIFEKFLRGKDFLSVTGNNPHKL